MFKGCDSGLWQQILKPAREDCSDDYEKPPVFTSSMDHPIGQLWAAYRAALFYKKNNTEDIPDCGLCTHSLYEKTDFSEQLGENSPYLKLPAGTGLGFDRLLDALPWSILTHH